MRQNTLIRPTVTASFISYIFPGGLYIIPSLCSKLQLILQNFHSYHKSFPQKQSLWSSSVYRARLRKQHGRHTCGFHLNDGYCMNAALSWVQRDEGPGSVWGKITYWFSCVMVPHWFNIHRHIEVGNELYQSLDTFSPCLPPIHAGSGLFVWNSRFPS